MSSNTDQLTVIALGGNLPGTFASVQGALEAAAEALPGAGFEVLRRSRWWRSRAWPDASHPPFLNAVALVQTRLQPLQALSALQAIEQRFGRRREAANAPRVLDLDLIAMGRQTVDGPRLILPHPKAAERLFVMGPLAEIAPDWRHPITGLAARDLAASAAVGRDAEAI